MRALQLHQPTVLPVGPHRPNTLQAAIVDLDGTLVDTLDDFVAALAATHAGLGLRPVDRAFVARSVGKGSEYLLRATLAEVGAAAGVYDTAFALYQQHYREINGRHARVFPGVEQGLARLTSYGLRLACLTNKPTAFARELLQKKGLAQRRPVHAQSRHIGKATLNCVCGCRFDERGRTDLSHLFPRAQAVADSPRSDRPPQLARKRAGASTEPGGDRGLGVCQAWLSRPSVR